MKLVFQSYSGAEWCYDIHSGVVKPYKVETNAIGKEPPEETTFFKPNPFSEEDLEQAWGREVDPFILNVTERCSNRCRYCVYGGAYAHERVHSQRVMALETAIKGIERYCQLCKASSKPLSLKIGLRTSSILPFKNGALDCRLLEYDVGPKAGVAAAEEPPEAPSADEPDTL